eukprot:4867892-Pyramimonas_sp.AAC.2
MTVGSRAYRIIPGTSPWFCHANDRRWAASWAAAGPGRTRKHARLDERSAPSPPSRARQAMSGTAPWRCDRRACGGRRPRPPRRSS